MKETYASFRARTGLAYAPPPGARALALAQPDGDPGAEGEACPTLYRWPGPVGLRDALGDRLERLAPATAAEVFLADDPRRTSDSGRAPATFGVVAVLEPWRLSPAEVRPGIYVGRNARLDDPQRIVWVPPAIVVSGIPDMLARLLDDVAGAADAIARFGPAYADARQHALAAVQSYLEELDELRRAGVPGPAVPWCDLDAAARSRTLADAGVTPLWTAATP